MGKRGPAPLPTAIKLAKGDRRPDRVNYDEPKLDAPDSLEPPAGLVGAGREEWEKLIGHLSDRGVLTVADLSAFEDYCRVLTQLRKLEEQIATMQEAGVDCFKEQGLSIKFRHQGNQLRQQCGLTPSSRSGVKAAKGAAAKAKVDPYLSALKGGKSA